MISKIFPLVAASSYISGITQFIGAENLELNTVEERMVWVPTTDSFGGGQGVRGNMMAGQKPNKRTRMAGVEIHIWGKSGTGNAARDDIEEVETLVNALIIAIHDQTHGSYDITGGAWMQQDGQEISQYGRGYILSVTFVVPVVKVDDGSSVAPAYTSADRAATPPTTPFDTTFIPFGGSI